MRRLADGIRPLLETLPDGPLKELVSRLDLRGLRPRPRRGRRARADARDERAARDCRPARARRHRRSERPTDVPARTASSGSTSGAGGERADLAAEPRLAARRPLRRLAATASACSISAQLPAARPAQLRGDVTAVEIDAARARELRENLARLGRADVTVVEADGTALPPELDGFDRALVDAPCSGLGVLAQRPDLRWRATPLPTCSSRCSAPPPSACKPGGTIVYSRLHAQPGRVRGGRRRERPRASLPLGDEWPQFAHPSRPEFLLTLPHVHGTSGFFIARLQVYVGCCSGLARVGPDGRDRAVALRGGLRAPRRADRRAPATPAAASSTSTSATATSSSR